jgi:hypothetical protein
MTRESDRRMDADRASEDRRESACTWSPLMADCEARIYGIARLDERHWKAIVALREEFLRSGDVPEPSAVCDICGLPHSELAELFPDTCNSMYALAGVPAPRATESDDPTSASADADTSNPTVSPDKEE